MASRVQLRHLEAFVAVGEELHFGRAAERLHLAQPPVSQRIISLESILGTKLFFRTTRSVKLTPVGERLLERAREILDSVEALALDAHRFNQGQVGLVRTGFTDLVALKLMPQLAIRFRELHPDIELDLRGSFFSYEEVEMLLSDDLDVGFIHGQLQHRELETVSLGAEKLLLAVAVDHPFAKRDDLSLADLQGEPFVTYLANRGSSIREIILADCAAVGFQPHIVQETEDSTAIIALVAAGVGLALVPESLQVFQPDQVAYRPISGTRGTIPVTAAWRRNESSPAVLNFVEVIRQKGELLAKE